MQEADRRVGYDVAREEHFFPEKAPPDKAAAALAATLSALPQGPSRATI
jgi:hypothetical protein